MENDKDEKGKKEYEKERGRNRWEEASVFFFRLNY